MSDQLAVIFDVDGVLVDSYAAHFRSWQALAEECGGFEMTEDQFAATFGRTSREILRDVWSGEPLTDARLRELDRRKEAVYRCILEQDFREIAGARALIAGLAEAGFLLAAGSSGPPENVSLVLDQLGQTDLFAAVVTGADVNRGKPDPQVFQQCADRLGLSPDRCAVIEDASWGIAAANAAGMVSIGLVSTGRSREEFRDADHVVDRLDALSAETLRLWIESGPAGSVSQST